MHVFTAPRCGDHEPGAGHPEAPTRLAAVLGALRGAGGVTLVDSAPAAPELLHSRHDAGYLARVAAACRAGGGALEADTWASPATWDATLAAAGASLASLDHALEGRGHAFAAIRPPGHHALRDQAMGFCLVNHVAVLAAEAHRRGRERVLIVDWDVHHGNGTQAMVEAEAATRFVSMHQWPWYPGTGRASDRGVGNCVNLPLPAGLPGNEYLEALWGGIRSATVDWTPDVVLVSAGYDAMRGDPLGGFTLEPADYAEWVQRLRTLWPEVPIVALMEGGYAPDRLAAGVLATVRALA